MEETKETKAARKEISVMEEARAKCKKYSTEAMVGKLILAGLDPEVISSSGRDDLINYTLTVDGFDVGVILPKKKEKELDLMQMMMRMMMEENKRREEEKREENKRREEENKRRDEENKRREDKREENKRREEEKREENKRREEENKRREEEKREENIRREEENKRREEEKREEKRSREEERLRRERERWEVEMDLKRQALNVAQGIRQENITREDTELRARDVRERELQAAADEKERLKREEQQKKSERLRRASKKLEKILPKMTVDELEIPMYFKTVENYFHEFEVEDDLKIALLLPSMNVKARKVITRLSRYTERRLRGSEEASSSRIQDDTTSVSSAIHGIDERSDGNMDAIC